MNVNLNDFQPKGTQKPNPDHGELNDFDRKVIRARVRESNRKWIAGKIWGWFFAIGILFMIVQYFIEHN